MVRAVAQIEQEIAALDQTVSAMAQAFYDAYQQYLTVLAKAMRQQFILAGYHICTHAYPEQFLRLSEEQRQALQQSLQRLAQQGQTELLACLQPIQVAAFESGSTSDSAVEDPAEATELEDTPSAEQTQDLPTPDAVDPEPTESEHSESTQPAPNRPEANVEAASFETVSAPIELDVPAPEPDPESQSNQLDESALTLAANLPDGVSILLVSSEPSLQNSLQVAASDYPSGNRLLHPKDIAYWQNHLEEAIVEVLQNLSHTTNCVLQQADILPSRLPEPVLEVAAKADLSSEASASPPNLLNLLIEADGEDEKLSMTQVMAMRLRLSEIEFGDAATAAHRSKLRHLMTQLGKLGREYQRKQKELAVAQAEAAWRASWFE